jgi:hypothetical protein
MGPKRALDFVKFWKPSPARAAFLSAALLFMALESLFRPPSGWKTSVVRQAIHMVSPPTCCFVSRQIRMRLWEGTGVSQQTDREGVAEAALDPGEVV